MIESTSVENVEAVPRSREIQLAGPRLPFVAAIEERFGVDRASWKALVEAIFPNAQSTESVVLALSYCRARKLDPFKRNVHIVPIYDKKRGCYVDTIWPGIGELRTTAFRTGLYAGRDDAKFGPMVTRRLGAKEIEFPEWCQVTVYRLVHTQRMAFAGPKVYWIEAYATRRHDDDAPNEMWETRVNGQIEKCAEAAALRAAFPEELGNETVADEVRGTEQWNATISNSAAPTRAELAQERLSQAPVKPQEQPKPVQQAPAATAEAAPSVVAPPQQEAPVAAQAPKRGPGRPKKTIQPDPSQEAPAVAAKLAAEAAEAQDEGETTTEVANEGEAAGAQPPQEPAAPPAAEPNPDDAELSKPWPAWGKFIVAQAEAAGPVDTKRLNDAFVGVLVKTGKRKAEDKVELAVRKQWLVDARARTGAFAGIAADPPSEDAFPRAAK